MGGDYFALCLALEELARVDSSRRDHPGGRRSRSARCRSTGSAPRSRRQQWLPRLTQRRGAGRVRPDRAGRRLRRRRHRAPAPCWTATSGSSTARKAFITNSGTDITALVTVTAVTGDEPGRLARSSRRSSCRPARPASPSRPAYSKVGWCASDTHELSFDDCRVPAANLLGERGRGYAQFLRILDEGRIAIAALSVGLAQGCVDESVRYAQRAPRLRPADRRLPGDPVQDRRHGAAGAHRPARLLRRRRADARRRAVQAAGRHRQAVRQRGRGGQRPRGHPGPRRLRLHERVPGRPASGATPRSWRSARAPPRSSACSSPATSGL